MRNKRLLKLLGALFLAALISISLAVSCAAPEPTPAPEHPIVTINLLTTSVGTKDYILQLELSKLLEQYHPWLRATVTETPGSTYMAMKFASDPSIWTNTAGECGRYITDILVVEDPYKYGALHDIRDVLGVNVVGPIFFQTFDSNIKTPADLIGKRIGLGTRAQTFWGRMAAAQLAVWGVTEQNSSLQWLGTAPMTAALIDGAVDACASAVYAGQGDAPRWQPSLPLSDASATGRTIYYIVATQEEALAAKGKNAWPIVGLPAGTLPGQEQDTWGLSLQSGRNAHKDLPDEIAYELVMFFLNHYEDFWPAHAVFKVIDPVIIGFSTGLPWHPGSLKAFNEWAAAHPDSEEVRYWKEWGTIE